MHPILISLVRWSPYIKEGIKMVRTAINKRKIKKANNMNKESKPIGEITALMSGARHMVGTAMFSDADIQFVKNALESYVSKPQQLNSKEIEQKAKEFLAQRGITSFTKHDVLQYWTTTDLLDDLEQFGAILTTACQQAQGDRWVSVEDKTLLVKTFPQSANSIRVLGINKHDGDWYVCYYNYDKGVFFECHTGWQRTITHYQLPAYRPLPTAPAEKKPEIDQMTEEHGLLLVKLSNTWIELDDFVGDPKEYFISILKGKISDGSLNYKAMDFLRLHYSI